VTADETAEPLSLVVDGSSSIISEMVTFEAGMLPTSDDDGFVLATTAAAAATAAALAAAC
jgi:hypothetical protein